MLRGPTSGGKSTIAKSLLDKLPDFDYINVDDIKTAMSDGVAGKNWHERANWFREANRQTVELLKQGKKVILDEAFSDPYLIKIALNGIDSVAEVKIVEIKYPLEVHLARSMLKSPPLDEETVTSQHNVYKTGYFATKASKYRPKYANDLAFSDFNLSETQIAENIISKINL